MPAPRGIGADGRSRGAQPGQLVAHRVAPELEAVADALVLVGHPRRDRAEGVEALLDDDTGGLVERVEDRGPRAVERLDRARNLGELFDDRLAAGEQRQDRFGVVVVDEPGLFGREPVELAVEIERRLERLDEPLLPAWMCAGLREPIWRVLFGHPDPSSVRPALRPIPFGRALA